MGLRSRRLLQVLPYAAVKGILRTYQENLNGTSFEEKVGGDIKLGLTSSLTLDVTVDPDFGQVEADQVILNLTTIEVLYPE